MKHSKPFVDLVDEARKHINECTVDDVKTKLDTEHDFHLVDVREESEWVEGHLPDAVHLSKGVIERDIVDRIPDPSDEIVLYCGGGYRSALAAENLQKMGYKNVFSMDGGYKAWVQAGHATEQS